MLEVIFILHIVEMVKVETRMCNVGSRNTSRSTVERRVNRSF